MPPRRGADAVGADEEVALRDRPVRERGAHAVGVLVDRHEPRAVRRRDPRRVGPLAQHLVQPAAAHDDAAALGLARRAVGHRAELLAGPAPHDHPAGAVAVGEQPVAQAERLQDGEAVRRDVEEQARERVGLRVRLVDVGVPAVPGEELCGRGAGDPAADDECSGHDVPL